MSRGRTLTLFLVDGTPSGVITAELGNWSGKAVVAPRTALASLIRRDEAGRTGVYLLVGPDPQLAGRQVVYVGESDQVRSRLIAHDADDAKQFFTRVCILVSKDENLTKAHARYLESKLIRMVGAAGRAKLLNGTEPEPRGLPEAAIADMDGFLDEVDVILPALGFDLLQPGSAEDPAVRPTPDANPVFVAEHARNARARAVERAGEFVVLAGSTALRRETAGAAKSIVDKRRALIEGGTLVPDSDPELLRFAADAGFDSPSGASGAVFGRNDNGRISWRIEGDGRSYGVWREQQLAAAVGATA